MLLGHSPLHKREVRRFEYETKIWSANAFDHLLAARGGFKRRGGVGLLGESNAELPGLVRCTLRPHYVVLTFDAHANEVCPKRGGALQGWFQVAQRRACIENASFSWHTRVRGDHRGG